MSNIIIETYKDQFETEMHRQCAAFCTVGTSVENPRWININKLVSDEDGFYLKFQSTQTNRIYFYIKISEKHYHTISRYMMTEFMWNVFKEFRTNFLRENYPTIEQYGI